MEVMVGTCAHGSTALRRDIFMRLSISRVRPRFASNQGDTKRWASSSKRLWQCPLPLSAAYFDYAGGSQFVFPSYRCPLFCSRPMWTIFRILTPIPTSDLFCPSDKKVEFFSGSGGDLKNLQNSYQILT